MYYSSRARGSCHSSTCIARADILIESNVESSAHRGFKNTSEIELKSSCQPRKSAVKWLMVASERGGRVFIFSDSDRDWLPAEPAYSITRHTSNSTLVLQVNWISRNRQQSASRQMNLNLGMMASPAKPQSTAPVSSARAWWPVSANLANGPNTVSTQLLALSLCWGQAQDITRVPQCGRRDCQ